MSVCGARHGSTSRPERQYHELAERYGVAAVICGHSELFERSFVDLDGDGTGGRDAVDTLCAVTSPERTPKDRLAQLITELAVVHGKVTLSSGRQADYYVDMRRLTLHHEGAPLIGHLMLDRLEEAGMGVGEIDAVGGPTMGADPVVCAIQHAAASRGLDLDAFLVRKEAKAHGMRRQVEGPDIAGRRVVIVEDTTTTGNSPMLAVEAARSVGAEVLGVATILDRETEATEVFARAGLPYLHLLSTSDLGLGRQ